ncbi:hypothetical protein GW17_00033338, partial [Ensete ventricosum]
KLSTRDRGLFRVRITLNVPFATLFLVLFPSSSSLTKPATSPSLFSSDPENLLPWAKLCSEGKEEGKMPNWELKNCCDHDQVAFIVTIGVFTFVILAVSSFFATMFSFCFSRILRKAIPFLPVKRVKYSQLICFSQVEGIQVHANEGGVTQTRGGIYWIILPAGCNENFLPLN